MWTIEFGGGGTNEVLGGEYYSTNGSCSGVTRAELLLDPPVRVLLPDGGVPAFVFHRAFMADADASTGTNCPASCSGYYGASATRTN